MRCTVDQFRTFRRWNLEVVLFLLLLLRSRFFIAPSVMEILIAASFSAVGWPLAVLDAISSTGFVGV